jgi:predicted transport protein
LQRKEDETTTEIKVKPKSRVTAIRAVQEMCDILYQKRSKKFDALVKELESKESVQKREIAFKIEKELEEYAVKKYGLKILVKCERTNLYKEPDKIRAELKIPAFPTLTDFQKEIAKIRKDRDIAESKIEDWYASALKALAKEIELPDLPEI